MSWSSRKKERIFFTVYFLRRKFCLTFVLFHCIVYCMHFQNIHTFTYQKALLKTLQLLVLKSPKVSTVSLIHIGDVPMYQIIYKKKKYETVQKLLKLIKILNLLLHQLYFQPNSQNIHICIPQIFFLPVVRSSQLPNFIKLSTRFKLADVTFETNL